MSHLRPRLATLLVIGALMVLAGCVDVDPPLGSRYEYMGGPQPSAGGRVNPVTGIPTTN